MNKKECAPFRKNIPAYALQALDEEEAAALESHLRDCASCREELVAYQLVSDNLLLALPPQVPPPGLRRRLEERLRSKREATLPRWRTLARSLAWAAVVAVLLALNLISLAQIHTLQRQQAELIEAVHTSQLALSMLAYPGTENVPIGVNAAQVSGTLLLDKDRNVAVLLLWNLPPLREDQVYQAWLIDAQGERISAAIFTPDPQLPFTTVSIFAPSPLAEFEAIGVTVEPRGGSTRPSGPRLLKVDF
jgi:anti-sigma-K factor RskA